MTIRAALERWRECRDCEVVWCDDGTTSTCWCCGQGGHVIRRPLIPACVPIGEV